MWPGEKSGRRRSSLRITKINQADERGVFMARICKTCDEKVPKVYWHAEEEQCTSCWECSGDGMPKYCCGNIYERGEDTCSSCGDPL